jgi:uncharacterized protein YecE (DUF72 family)
MPSSQHNGRLYIGTSGWSYTDWSGAFYPRDLSSNEYLSYYAARFPTTEVNSTFYNLLESKTFRGWADTVPADFRFSVKASRYITHIKRLKDSREPFETFLGGVQALKRRLGPILVQLPPNFKLDTERLATFLSNAQDARYELGVRKRLRFAFEFRHPSWFSDTDERREAIRILHRHNCAFVFGHSGEYPYPEDEPVTADFVYMRFHGPRELFASQYGPEHLSEWAPRIREWLARGTDVYAYFNNDMNAYAIEDARTLHALIAGSGE